MLTKQQLGRYYERQACLFLQENGLRLIANNCSSRLGELDLIMQDDQCLVFIEVRYRKNELYGDALSSITQDKQNKVIKAAYSWMQQQNIDIEAVEFRFDVFAITGQDQLWLKNAFSA